MSPRSGTSVFDPGPRPGGTAQLASASALHGLAVVMVCRNSLFLFDKILFSVAARRELQTIRACTCRASSSQPVANAIPLRSRGELRDVFSAALVI